MKILKLSLIAAAMGLFSANSFAATYQVVDLGHDNARQSFALGINNHDEVIGVSKDHFNFPIDVDNLDKVTLSATLDAAKSLNPDSFSNVNMEDIENGEFNADALAFTRSFLLSTSANILTQRIGDQSAFTASASGIVEEVAFFDPFDEGLNSKTRNTIDLINAINDDGISVSSVTTRYQKTEFTPQPTDAIPEPATITYWLRDGLNGKGVIAKGEQRVVVESEATEYGGESYLTDISNSGYVVGYAAANFTETAQEGFDSSCGELTTEVEIQLCVVNLYSAMASSTTTNMFDIRAFRWKINEALEVVETTDLGLTFTPNEDDERSHSSFSTGVNEQGHVAGYADDFLGDVSTTATTRQFATYYDGQSLIRITDPDDYFDSRAYDINDNNIVVGYGTTVVNSIGTRQFFYYDGDTGTAVYPDGFFSSSASEAHGINNQGQIVGLAQIDSSFGTVRRERGFIYDIANETMTDLNEFTGCDSPYTIVEAKDINDNGVIVGTALLTVDRKDTLGNVIITDGIAEQEDVARAVKLVPIAGGSVDDCEVVAPPGSERQGASLGGYSLLLLLGLFSRRRLVR